MRISLFSRISVICVATLSCIAVSCKKEYVKTPFTDIESFSVTDSTGKTVQAAITGDTIRLYWAPFNTVPTSITPKIVVAQGASISPASGEKVKFKGDTQYTVTAQDGSKHLYHLYLMVNQPAPDFLLANGSEHPLGDYVYLGGQYFVPDTNQTKVSLISVTGKSFPVTIVQSQDYIFSATKLTFKTPIDGIIDTGMYKVKVATPINSSTRGPVHLIVPNLYDVLTSSDEGKSFKPGQRFSLTVPSRLIKYYIKDLANVSANIYTDNGSFKAMVTISGNIITLMVPADAATGGIGEIDFINASGDIVGQYFPKIDFITISN